MQEGNVANQREHLILLLANVHIRQFPKSDQQPKVSNLLQIYRVGVVAIKLCIHVRAYI